MAILDRVWLIHTTSRVEHANADGAFRLDINSVGRTTPNNPGIDERERGTTDEYELDFRSAGIEVSDIQPGDISLTALSGDAWLPERIWLIGRDVDNGFHLLVRQFDWPESGWFSTQMTDAGGAALETRSLN